MYKKIVIDNILLNYLLLLIITIILIFFLLNTISKQDVGFTIAS